MLDEFFETVCQHRRLARPVFVINATLFVLLLLVFPFVEPGSSTYYVSLVSFFVIGVTLLAGDEESVTYGERDATDVRTVEVNECVCGAFYLPEDAFVYEFLCRVCLAVSAEIWEEPVGVARVVVGRTFGATQTARVECDGADDRTGEAFGESVGEESVDDRDSCDLVSVEVRSEPERRSVFVALGNHHGSLLCSARGEGDKVKVSLCGLPGARLRRAYSHRRYFARPR
jgi:hypothetical protein